MLSAEDFVPNSNEQLIHRLCSKLANDSGVSVTSRDHFVNSNFTYLIRVLASSSYAANADQFEIGQKIKKKRKFRDDTLIAQPAH